MAEPTNPTELPFSRRAFLAVGAAGAGAIAAASLAGATPDEPIVAPPSTPASKGRGITPVKPGDPVRMGVIGTGGMGSGHCNAFLDFNGPDADKAREKVEIVGLADVCDPRVQEAKAACEAKQGGRTVETYRDHRKLLERDDVRAVVIASPEHWHARHAADAIMAGKDVYVEKPMTFNLADALYLRSVAQANPDVIVQVGTQMVQLPKYAAARKLIRDGAIGKPVWSQTSYCRNSKTGEWLYYNIDPAWKPGVNLDWDTWCGGVGPVPWNPEVYARWRRYRTWSSGIIGDLLVHVMTPMMVALDMGYPTRVVASGGHYVDQTMENHDQVNITVELEGGHTLVVAGSTCNEVGLETMIRGHEGTIYLGGRHCVVKPERIFVDDGRDEQRVECPDIGNDQDVHRLKFLECVRTRQKPESDIEQGTRIMVIVDLATRSLWDGAAYRFDPKTMTAWRV